MAIQHHARSLTVAALIGLLAVSNALPTRAATAPPLTPTPATPEGLGATGIGGTLDPFVPPATPAQLADHAHRLDVYKASLVQRGINPDGDPGNYGGQQGSVVVVAWSEPNDYAHRNYCGPGSSQVTISNWNPNGVPGIDQLGSEESTDPNGGTLLGNMVGPINNHGNTNSYYNNQVAGSQGTFNDWVGADIGFGHPLITAIQTMGNGYTLNGWGLNTAHIVSIYAYNFVTPGAGTIGYVETSGTVAGTSATGRQNFGTDPFWSLVTLNNGQIW